MENGFEDGNHDETHHLTYKYGWDCGGDISHLQALCRDCHRFVGGFSKYDPCCNGNDYWIRLMKWGPEMWPVVKMIKGL